MTCKSSLTMQTDQFCIIHLVFMLKRLLRPRCHCSFSSLYIDQIWTIWRRLLPGNSNGHVLFIISLKSFGQTLPWVSQNSAFNQAHAHTRTHARTHTTRDTLIKTMAAPCLQGFPDQPAWIILTVTEKEHKKAVLYNWSILCGFLYHTYCCSTVPFETVFSNMANIRHMLVFILSRSKQIRLRWKSKACLTVRFISKKSCSFCHPNKAKINSRTISSGNTKG